VASDSERTLRNAVTAAAQPLTGAPNDYDALLEAIGDASVVCLGEASHGTYPTGQ
jgi:erythromycin esterase-like protein